MNNKFQRFLDAQEGTYESALQEIKNGKKQSHWMWYIFPQIAGLGFSPTAQYYAIQNLEEAKEYLANNILRNRLVEISSELLKVNTNNAVAIFGTIDARKLKSSMTLFYVADPTNTIFISVLEKFFNGELDNTTLQILNHKN